MAELKTKKTDQSVEAFLKKSTKGTTLEDCLTLVSWMEKATGSKAKLWGSAIIGFGDRTLKYESGRELDWFIMGFSPRKQNLALYINGAVKTQSELLKTLGKHKTGKGCLYIQSLADINASVLKKIIANGLKE